MNLEDRIASFVKAGERLRNYSLDDFLSSAAKTAEEENPWFTQEQISHALVAWSGLLGERQLTEWLEPYRSKLSQPITPKTIGSVMAGNIPMVGFHDMLCVLISGNRLKAKLSSQDRRLLPAFCSVLSGISPEWTGYISFEEGLLSGFDAVIATGSNNTSRYFHYYFGKYPHIIRTSRNSVAVLTGNETDDELRGLASDIFLYFGLGCRSVSKLFLPEGYAPERLTAPFSGFAGYYHHHKYRNNYDYHRSIFMLDRTPCYDGGFYLMKEDPSPSSPVSVIHYAYYRDMDEVEKWIELEQDHLQCVVSSGGLAGARVLPGMTQSPGLGDYADGIDTMVFLTEKI